MVTSLPVFDLGQVASTVVLDQLREGIIVTDAAGAIRFVNEAARAMHGVAELDVEPKDYSDRYHLFTLEGEPHPFEDLPLARAVGGETVVDAPWVIRRPDGTEVYAVGSAKPLLGADGEQIGAVLTIRDETESFKARSELRESEETVRAFFETAGVYAAVIDLMAEDFTLVMGNSRMAKAFGLEVLTGQSGRTVLGDRRAQTVIADLRRAAVSDEPIIVEYPWNTDGNDRWFVTTITKMSGTRERLFLASLDITDRKRAERDLAAALKTKDVLLHEVNHRVKNSLHIITSLLELQESSGDDDLTAHLREARGRVETVARVHERLYKTSAHDRVEIVGYLEDLLTHVVASVGQRDGIDFEFCERGGEVELAVEYSVPLGLILVEIAMNAVKYGFPSGSGGTVSVETEIADGHLSLTIYDDGVGVDAGPKDQGTGLGRQIVRALAMQLNAEVGYLKRPRGTAFNLTMPLPDADAKS
ncbi:MAG: PAS domain S-box protein [Erythrobacter sp.]|nr:PAS domain S-box protein [Erythrobacter sp.]